MKPSDRAPKSRAGCADLPELSIVLPTFKERGNVAELVRRLDVALSGIRWEADLRRRQFTGRHRQCGRRTSHGRDPRAPAACAVSAAAASRRRLYRGQCSPPAPPTSLSWMPTCNTMSARWSQMLETLRADRPPPTSSPASCYTAGGSADFFDKQRAAPAASRPNARRVLGVSLTDPMSGFFMMRARRSTTRAATVASGLQDPARPRRDRARPLQDGRCPSFGSRQHGESKLNSMVALEFLGWCWPSSPAIWSRCASALRDGRRHRSCSCISARCPVAALSWFRGSAAARRHRRHDHELHPQQFHHLSRPRLKGSAILRGLLAFYLVCSVGLSPMSAWRFRSMTRSRSGGSRAPPAR